MRTFGGELLDRALELLDAPVDLVDSQQIVVKGLLLTDPFERLASQPHAAGRSPALRRHPQVVAQQELPEAMASAHPVQPGILTGPHQISQGLLLQGRDEHVGQQSRGVQAGQSARVALIGLHAIRRRALGLAEAFCQRCWARPGSSGAGNARVVGLTAGGMLRT